MKNDLPVLVLGASGSLGAFVTQVLAGAGHSVLAPSGADWRIKAETQGLVLDRISTARPRVVINLIGMTREVAESATPENVLLVNSVFPQNLAMYLYQRQIPLIHISTDCVFKGSADQIYDEFSICDAQDIYGLSKAAGESRNCMVLRGSFLGPNRDPATGLLGFAHSNKGKELTGFSNQYWNGITHLNLARALEEIISKEIYEPGIFHIPGPETVSRLKLLQLINEAFGLKISLVESKADYPRNRILKSVRTLRCAALDQTLDNQIVDLLAWMRTLAK